MNSPQTPATFKDRLNSMLTAAGSRTVSAPRDSQNQPVTQVGNIAKAADNPKPPEGNAAATSTKPNPRNIFLDQLPAAQQVDILKWAERHGINPNDPLWLLIDLMKFTKSMTDTLPSQMRAAGQQAVEAIAQQRQAETDAFSANTQRALGQMLAGITAQVARASDNLTETRLRKKLWQHGLWAASGISMLSAMCFILGYMFADTHLHWVEAYSHNVVVRMLQAILGLPIGYLVIPMALAAMVLFLIDEIAQWRNRRQWW